MGISENIKKNIEENIDLLLQKEIIYIAKNKREKWTERYAAMQIIDRDEPEGLKALIDIAINDNKWIMRNGARQRIDQNTVEGQEAIFYIFEHSKYPSSKKELRPIVKNLKNGKKNIDNKLEI